MTCVIDLFNRCPTHQVTHWDQVPTTDFDDPTITTTLSPQGTESETVMSDYDFETQMLTHAYVEARALADGKVPVFDNSSIDL